MQHWDSGDRMDISSLACFPNLVHKQHTLNPDSEQKQHHLVLSSGSVSPSGIVQVKKEAFVPKLGKNLIVVSVHVPCNKGVTLARGTNLYTCS